MRKELIVKSKSLAGVSDLTLFATIRQGFVPSLESVTYKTRLQMLLKTLSAARSSSQEYSLVRPFSDSVERVGAIHSVRLAIVEPENKLMLAVTFDGAWENYIRTLWLKVGTLLDAIFCNTEDYVVAHDHGYEAWAAWARRVQAETQFFYGAPALTVWDVQYLRKTERAYRDDAAAGDLQMAGAIVERPEDVAWAAATAPANQGDTFKQGLQALSVLYRLADVYLPGTPDGDVLLRAARDLLLELAEAKSLDALLQGATPPFNSPTFKLVRARFERQLKWFVKAAPERPRAMPTPTPFDRRDVQAGILNSLKITHGCLLLISLPDVKVAAAFLARLASLVAHDETVVATGEVIHNAAFTFEGLRVLGLSEPELAAFPQEFREGMEARASVLGDFRANHPRRWHLPLRHGAGALPGAPRVELSAVHLVVQLRVDSPTSPRPFDDVTHTSHPLKLHIDALLQDSGVSLLSVQPLWRNSDDSGQTREHFGFVDGISQPGLGAAPPGSTYDRPIHLGDILLGHPNTFDPAPPPNPLLHNGSFLVVRKLRQDVAALNKVVDAACAATGLTHDEVLAKMMGRKLNGDPLVPAGSGGRNDFDYSRDADGRMCPFQAHVRRANPRTPSPSAPQTDREVPVPRIMRRGMSYGPLFNAGLPDDDPTNAAERGILFMAYNARIAEQFEVIQRWISGGNSSGVLSAQSDPFLGVAQRGDPRTCRFVDQSAGKPAVKRMQLDDPSSTLDDPGKPPVVRLEWGAYLFTPSIKTLSALQRIAANASGEPQAVWSVDEGDRIIDHLIRLQSQPGLDLASMWKSALEDPTDKREFKSAAVWAAIRERRGGVLRTPYGVLVAGRALVDQVFVDTDQRYTVQGYKERTGLSFGEIYLGLDRDAPGGPYDVEATLSNRAIRSIGREDAFRLSEKFALKIIEDRIALDNALAQQFKKPGWELNLDTKEVSDDVLAHLCDEWFGLQQAAGLLEHGGLRWDWTEGEPLLYPGHFTAPSRYVFQPAPGLCPMRLGWRHGQALRTAVRQFADTLHATQQVPLAPSGQPAIVSAAIFNDPRARFFGPKATADTDWIARTLVGALVGFLPSVDGNFRATLNEWLRDGDFWRLREQWAANTAADSYDKAIDVLWAPMERTMQLRPSPELVWRTARKAHRLGSVDVNVGDLIVVAIVSATQDDLVKGKAGVWPIFGGERSAQGPQPGFATHACPGYAAGMGALLGMYSALMQVKEAMRPSPAPLSLTLTGRSMPPASAVGTSPSTGRAGRRTR